jgi:hypothetical protein
MNTRDVNRVLRGQATKETELSFHKVMAAATLLHKSESWGEENKNVNQIQAAEIKFFRSIKLRTRLDKIKNEHIRKEWEIDDYKEEWLTHSNRMNNNRLPKRTVRCKPKL